MKLHSIETLNLNSLYDEQGVDFDEDLRGASLFLIQGPTGAGKSTLMDAVSLALFGQTPRLTGTGKVVAEGVMSRGTGGARAAVCFSKLEVGARVYYRAAWLARRARNKPGGKVQQPVRSLERLRSGGDRSADKDWKTLVSSHKAQDYTPRFDEVLEGFGPEDFQRTMLLAQGKFDALIEAHPNKRASILERLTQTGEYKRLGETAARVAAAWRTRLGELGVAARSQTSLSPEQIEAARAEAATHAAEVTRLTAERERVSAGLRWLRDDDAKAKAVHEADAAQTRAMAEQRALAPSVAALAEHERCADAFVALDARDGQRRQLREAEDRLQRARDLLPQRVEDEGRLRVAQERATAAAHAAEEAERALQPTLTAAETATAAQERAQRELRKATDLATSAKRRQDESARQLDRVSAEVTTRQAQAETAAQRLAAVAEDAPLAEALPPLREQVAGLHEAARALREANEDLAQQAANVGREATGLARERERHEAALAAKLQPLQQAAAGAQAALEALAPDAAAAERRALERDQAREGHLRRREAAQAAQQLAAQAARDAEVAAAAAAALTTAEAEAARSAAAKATAEAALAAPQAAREAAAALRAPHARYLALRDARSDLAEGEPCPLCGSDSHPDGHGERAAAKTQEAEAAVAEADRREAEAEAALHQARTAVAEAQAALTRAQTTVGLRQEQRAAAAATASESARALADALADPGPEGALVVAHATAATRPATGEDPTARALAATGEQLAEVARQSGAAAEVARREREALRAAVVVARGAAEALATAEQAFAEAQRRLGERDAALAERGRERARQARTALAQTHSLAQRCRAVVAALAALQRPGNGGATEPAGPVTELSEAPATDAADAAQVDAALAAAQDDLGAQLSAVDDALQVATAKATAWQDAHLAHTTGVRERDEAIARQRAASEAHASHARAAAEAVEAQGQRQTELAATGDDVARCRRALRAAWHGAGAHDAQWAAWSQDVQAHMAAQGGITTHADRDTHVTRPGADMPLRVLAQWQRALVAALQGLAQHAREQHNGAQQALVACRTQVTTLTEGVSALRATVAAAQAALDAALATLGAPPPSPDATQPDAAQPDATQPDATQAAGPWGPLDEVGLHNRRLSPAEVREIRADQQRLAREVATAEGRLVSAREALASHRATRPPVVVEAAQAPGDSVVAANVDGDTGDDAGGDTGDDAGGDAGGDAGAPPQGVSDPADNATLGSTLQAALAELERRRAEVADQLRQAQGVLAVAAKEAEQLAAAQATLRAAQAKAKVWLHLHELIGVGDGEAFKRFAQALNLGQLLRQANTHLRALKGRYRFAVVRDDESGLPTLDFEVEDLWQPGVRRGLKTLSGGETFLASLALALGLSDLRTTTMPVDTLLLDEGFGTLDPDTLDDALQALQALQASGRQVGIISHVVGLQERIQARIRVEPLGEGRSRVLVG